MGTPRIHLNERDFAADVALGEMTRKDIAAKHGMSPSYVGDISRGRRRPHVRPLIEQLQSDLDLKCKRDARHRLVQLVEPAVSVFHNAMEGDVSTTSLSAAKELLHRILGSDWSPDDVAAGPVEPELDLAELSPETKLQVLKELGGPLEEGPYSPPRIGSGRATDEGVPGAPFEGARP